MYQYPTKRHHSRQLMLGRSTHSARFSRNRPMGTWRTSRRCHQGLYSRSELKIVNDRADLSDMPGAHRGREGSYGVFQTGNRWVINRGSMTNTILRCPLWQRCRCPCEAKIVISPTNTIVFISNLHTAEHHSKDKDKSVYLSFQEKTMQNICHKGSKNFANAIR